MRAAADFDTWAEGFAADWVRACPQLATMMQYFAGDEQDALDRRLSLMTPFGTPHGVEAARAQTGLARRGLAELSEFRTDDLDPQQQISAAIFALRLQGAIDDAAFAQQRFIFDQFLGLHVGLVFFLSTVHPMRNLRDAENYLARLKLVPALLDAGIAEAEAAAAAGIVPPRFIVERTLAQLETLTREPLAEHPLVASFSDRLSAPAPTLASEVEREVRERIVPALRRVGAMLARHLERAGDAAGAWSLPSGDAFYKRSLVAFTGSNLSAEEIHALGLREVARLESEMDRILRDLGHTAGSVGERVVRVNEERRSRAETPSRETILAEIAAVIADASQRSRALFNLHPKAPVVVEREPDFSEQSAAAHYGVPAPDGSRPGTYYVPLADVSANVPWLGIGLKSTAYHEAIPGHHYQLAIEQESETLPGFRRRRAFCYDASFNEGWALYAERLCAENGWYEGDLASELGYLEMQLFRARRLVVDTGLHALRWTRQQAIDYGLTAAEVERYIVWPGQACAYMLGQLKILELRERARAVLGERFSLKTFHDLIVGGGTMPLAVLESRIDAWAKGPEKGRP
ncbi:MAG: DUF885 domain-containing protein [Candidatus Eremiobacteraeota bacterium]|nr:DUF885 domain-containing protein [Candidatus Eremiobacteraeota bacterium]